VKINNLSGLLDASLIWKTGSAFPDSKTLITVSNRHGEKSVLITSRGMKLVDSNDYVIAPKERARAKVSTFKRITSIALKTIGWSLVSLMLVFAGASVTGLIDSRVVLTGSMTPTINPGDVVVSTSPSRLKPHVGSVVIYTGKKFDGSTVASFAHRIVGGDAVNGFTMKGDNNPDADVQKPKLADIEGVVFLTIPFLGKLLSPQVLIILLLAAFGVWLIVDAFRDEE
jgi:signal peptidase I